MVECHLGDNIHAGVDELYDDGNPIGFLAGGIHGLSYTSTEK